MCMLYVTMCTCMTQLEYMTLCMCMLSNCFMCMTQLEDMAMCMCMLNNCLYVYDSVGRYGAKGASVGIHDSIRKYSGI